MKDSDPNINDKVRQKNIIREIFNLNFNKAKKPKLGEFQNNKMSPLRQSAAREELLEENNLPSTILSNSIYNPAAFHNNSQANNEQIGASLQNILQNTNPNQVINIANIHIDQLAAEVFIEEGDSIDTGLHALLLSQRLEQRGNNNQQIQKRVPNLKQGSQEQEDGANQSIQKKKAHTESSHRSLLKRKKLSQEYPLPIVRKTSSIENEGIEEQKQKLENRKSNYQERYERSISNYINVGNKQKQIGSYFAKNTCSSQNNSQVENIQANSTKETNNHDQSHSHNRETVKINKEMSDQLSKDIFPTNIKSQAAIQEFKQINSFPSQDPKVNSFKLELLHNKPCNIPIADIQQKSGNDENNSRSIHSVSPISLRCSSLPRLLLSQMQGNNQNQQEFHEVFSPLLQRRRPVYKNCNNSPIQREQRIERCLDHSSQKQKIPKQEQKDAHFIKLQYINQLNQQQFQENNNIVELATNHNQREQGCSISSNNTNIQQESNQQEKNFSIQQSNKSINKHNNTNNAAANSSKNILPLQNDSNIFKINPVQMNNNIINPMQIKYKEIFNNECKNQFQIFEDSSQQNYQRKETGNQNIETIFNFQTEISKSRIYEQNPLINKGGLINYRSSNNNSKINLNVINNNNNNVTNSTSDNQNSSSIKMISKQLQSNQPRTISQINLFQNPQNIETKKSEQTNNSTRIKEIGQNIYNHNQHYQITLKGPSPLSKVLFSQQQLSNEINNNYYTNFSQKMNEVLKSDISQNPSIISNYNAQSPTPSLLEKENFSQNNQNKNILHSKSAKIISNHNKPQQSEISSFKQFSDYAQENNNLMKGNIHEIQSLFRNQVDQDQKCFLHQRNYSMPKLPYVGIFEGVINNLNHNKNLEENQQIETKLQKRVQSTHIIESYYPSQNQVSSFSNLQSPNLSQKSLQNQNNANATNPQCLIENNSYFRKLLHLQSTSNHNLSPENRQDRIPKDKTSSMQNFEDANQNCKKNGHEIKQFQNGAIQPQIERSQKRYYSLIVQQSDQTENVKQMSEQQERLKIQQYADKIQEVILKQKKNYILSKKNIFS